MSDLRTKVRMLFRQFLEWLEVNRRAMIEHGKTLLIILLFLSAFFLAEKTGLFGGEEQLAAVKEKIASVLRGSDGNGSLLSDREYAEAAIPLVMTISPEAGTRYAVTYSAEVEPIFHRFSAYLGEALGSAGIPETVTRAEWEKAVSGKGVFFDYVYPQNLRCIAAWQGTDVPAAAGSHYARRLFLAVETTGVTLYYIADDTDVIYRCGTALAEKAMETHLTVYQSNNASLAFENETYAALDPDTVILPGASEVRSVSVTNPGAAVNAEEVLHLFGMNYITASYYLENDGSMVYLDGDSTLRIGTDGVIHFERGDGEGSAPEEWEGMVSLPDVVDGLLQTTEKLVKETAGDGGITLTQASYRQQQEEYTVTFDYSVDGMRVCLPMGSAAEYTVSEGMITSAVVRLRQYQLTGETQTPLPIVQAAALVAASGGREPVQVYRDTGDSVTVSWMMQ